MPRCPDAPMPQYNDVDDVEFDKNKENIKCGMRDEAQEVLARIARMVQEEDAR